MDKAPAAQTSRGTAGGRPVQDRAIRRAPPTISGCCRAILAHFAIDPAAPAADHHELRIGGISRDGGHIAMTLLLPMPYGQGDMTIDTIGAASITLPGMSLSPAIRAAALRQPIGRLTGHPAFAALDHLVVTEVKESCDAGGRRCTILRFDDMIEPLHQARGPAASRLLH
ncbi:hypothetical protein [Sphingomonas profundi]|uniref:hypothetical protein n=1 Tax=Alterirhizorhabdus profundi TaxID=2681549 RepID=UPI0012E8A64B|nr:hypothetical protein [Sphingomonas profundi]